METAAEFRAKAAWRVAVTQGLTLLGFNEWLIDCGNYRSDRCNSGANELLARAGSDEFVVVLASDASQHEAARRVASSMIARGEGALRGPDIGRALSGSLGIALFPNYAADAGSLLVAADRQCFEAQHQGKGT